MNTIERICRALCIQRGLDPDAKVVIGVPHYVDAIGPVFGSAYYVPKEDWQVTLWTLYEPLVRQTIEQLQKPVFGLDEVVDGGWWEDLSPDVVWEKMFKKILKEPR